MVYPREIWRRGDSSIHVTGGGHIGIKVDGCVVFMPVEKWHEIGWAALPNTFEKGTEQLCEKIAELERELEQEQLKARIRYLENKIEEKRNDW